MILYFAMQSIFMRTVTKLLLLTLAIVFMAARKKLITATANNSGGTGGTGEPGTNTNNIEGDYDFVGMAAHTESSITVDASGSQVKAVTVSDYLTKDNTGTMKITSDQFICTNLGYSIDTIVNVKTYLDNVLFDDSDVPFAGSTPPTNGATPYVRNSADQSLPQDSWYSI
jgi:uncharacterized protein YdeI (BOF family)